MKHRNLLPTVILGYVTLGIYGLYWLIVTRRSLVEKLGNKKAVPSVLLLFVPFFLIAAAIIVAVLFRSNTAANIMIILTYLIALIVGPIISIYWFYKFTNALHQVAQGIDPILHLVLAIIMWSVGLGPVWLLLAQNEINKYLESGGGLQPAPQANPVAEHNPQPVAAAPSELPAAPPPEPTTPAESPQPATPDQPPTDQPTDQNEPPKV